MPNHVPNDSKWMVAAVLPGSDARGDPETYPAAPNAARIAAERKSLVFQTRALVHSPSSEDASAASRAVAELELVIVTAEDDEYKGERLAEDKGRFATAGRNWKPSVVLVAAIAAKRRAVSFMVLSDEVESMVREADSVAQTVLHRMRIQPAIASQLVFILSSSRHHDKQSVVVSRQRRHRLKYVGSTRLVPSAR